MSFTVEGQSFECELCDDHLAEFREAMEVWSSHARQAGAGRSGRSGGRGRGGSRGASTAEVREWARGQGMEVSSHGRVSAELRAAYDAAH